MAKVKKNNNNNPKNTNEGAILGDQEETNHA